MCHLPIFPLQRSADRLSLAAHLDTKDRLPSSGDVKHRLEEQVERSHRSQLLWEIDILGDPYA